MHCRIALFQSFESLFGVGRHTASQLLVSVLNEEHGVPDSLQEQRTEAPSNSRQGGTDAPIVSQPMSLQQPDAIVVNLVCDFENGLMM